MKIFTSLLFGLLLIMPLDFIIFIGLKKHYFDFYEMNLFFNIYFFDNQPFLLLLAVSLVFGFFLLYTKARKILQLLYIILLLTSFSSLYHPIGNMLGQKFFKKPNINCTLGSQKFKVDLLYEGRKYYFLKRAEIRDTIKIKKDVLTLNAP